MIYKKLTVLILSLVLFCEIVHSAKILGLFFYSSRSHYILGNSLMKGLAEAGHDVTIISPYEDKQPPSNGSYRSIVLTGFAEEYSEMMKKGNFLENNPTNYGNILGFRLIVLTMITNVFDHPNVKALLKSGEKFDAVIVQSFFNEAMSVLGHHFDAPLIWYCSTPFFPAISDMFANPSPLSYIPYCFRDFSSNMSFLQRVENVFSYFFNHVLVDSYIHAKESEILKIYFPNAPDYNDLFYNGSLVLINTHESLTDPIPLTPNLIDIGGHHVTPPKKLPKHLQDYLDAATEGVIYFSMGSNIKSKDFIPAKRDALLRAFGKMKQKVLWKWEDDNLPGQPPNVKTEKWFPQQDILAHPNVKVFITHGGLLSTTETIYHGVPILAIPVFADQNTNAQNAERGGYGLSIPYRDPNFSEERISYSLNELIYNPKYSKNVKERSKVFHDRPMKPMDAAVFWVEYVIRHKGAPRLRVAGIGMPWYKYHLLDVIAFLAAITLSVLFLLYLGIRCLLRRRKRPENAQKVKKS